MPLKLAEFYNTTRAARKVIVVDLGFLGDTIHLAPALWELRRHYSEAELHVLTTPVGVEVLQLLPCVTRAWAIEMQPAKRTLRQQWEVLRALRSGYQRTRCYGHRVSFGLPHRPTAGLRRSLP